MTLPTHINTKVSNSYVNVGNGNDTAKRVILYDANGNPINLTTNDDGQLHVVLQTAVDPNNSTTTPMNADSVFTGVTKEILSYIEVTVTVYSDVASAIDGLELQTSIDGITWRVSDTYTIPANNEKTFTVQIIKEYFRVVYTNGSSDQSTFELTTLLKKTRSKPSSHRIQDSINSEDDAELVKSVLTGIGPDSVFRNANVTIDGDLKISDNSSGLSIAKGDVSGVTFIHKFGDAPDFDAGDGYVNMWDGADDGDLNAMQYTYSTSADIDSLACEGADTSDYEVQGLDSNWNLLVQTVTANGTARVALTPLIRVFRIKNVGSVDNANHVNVFVNDTMTTIPGRPDDISLLRASIHPNNNQTLMCIYTIPSGKTGYLRDLFCSVSGAKRSSSHITRVEARPFGGVFQLKYKAAINDTGTSYMRHQYVEPERFSEKTDIQILVNTDQSEAGVSGGFDIVLIDN